MSTHELKTWPGPFNALLNGSKAFELRDNDRDFKVGDLLVLREWNPQTSDYTGAALVRAVTYMLEGPAFGLPEGKVIMSLK